MKPRKGPKAIATIGITLGLIASLSGCSSRSPLSIYIASITGTDQANYQRTYLECDIIGSEDHPCTAVQDMIRVDVQVEDAESLGPTLDVYMTGFTVEYFYFDPTDGSLKGPVPELTMRGTNLRLYFEDGYNEFQVPAVTYRVKTWSVGVTCHDLIGYGGVDNVTRLIIRVTVYAEDATGKTTSASGSMLAYLYDYAPPPLDPSVSQDTDRTWCYGITPEAYWSALCP